MNRFFLSPKVKATIYTSHTGTELFFLYFAIFKKQHYNEKNTDNLMFFSTISYSL